MTAHETQMSEEAAPRRMLSRALLFALICSTALFAESRNVADFEIFGIRLWGSSNDQDADIVDPLRYAVTIVAPDADRAFLKKLEEYQKILGDNKTLLLLSSQRELFDLLLKPPSVAPAKSAPMSENKTPTKAGG